MLGLVKEQLSNTLLFLDMSLPVLFGRWDQQYREFPEGDEVVVSPAMYCGVCRNCCLGRHHYCQYLGAIGADGFDKMKNGAFAEYLCIRGTSLFPKSAGLSFDAAALTEPPAVVIRGLINRSRSDHGGCRDSERS